MNLQPQINETLDLERVRSVLGQLRPDDFVNLSFEAHDPQHSAITGESIWLLINEWDGNKGVGEINNVPLLLPCSIGQPVEFEARHIFNISLADF